MKVSLHTYYRALEPHFGDNIIKGYVSSPLQTIVMLIRSFKLRMNSCFYFSKKTTSKKFTLEQFHSFIDGIKSQRKKRIRFSHLGAFHWEMIMRSNFMRSKFNFFRRSNFRSWDRNSTFSGGRIFDHEIEIQFVHEIKFICKIDQEIE